LPDAAEARDKETDVRRAQQGELSDAKKKIEEPPLDTRSQNEAKSLPKVAKESADEQPGENDSGVNVEDVHNDEPDHCSDAVQRRTNLETPAVDVSSENGDACSRRASPLPGHDGSTSSPSRHPNARKQNGDVDRLFVSR